MDNHAEEEKRQRQEENNSTILKLKEIKNVCLYWNSMSEMFIPTSVWDQSHDEPYGVFQFIEADMVHDFMKDIFLHRVGIQNSYIVDPFSLRIQFAFRNSYNMLRDDYKYRIAVVNDKVRLNLNPITLCDVMRLRQYFEGFSYSPDLKRFRPQIRIQAFLDLRARYNGTLPPNLEAKRQAVVRDWFRLVLWFVRLRKAAKG
mmetsp:Transcript_8327/g.13926  ORF Transcript_8327/g.13926 Transcript_8327/m.13926 type:complete len:201 (-) Transcript_8327:2702-3304(-)